MPQRRWPLTVCTASSSSARVSGTPLGSVTYEACSAGSAADRSLARATEAITEQARAIPAHASLRTALDALSLSGTTCLLVAQQAQPVAGRHLLSDFDLAIAAGR